MIITLYACQCQCQSKIFSVAKIAKLLRRPRVRMIKAQCQEKTGEKEMFSDVDGRQTEKKMLGCRMAMNSKRVMQRSTVVSPRNDGTSSWCDDADRSRRRLGRFTCPCSHIRLLTVQSAAM